jgi:putative ATPase
MSKRRASNDEASLFATPAATPLAARMRPRALDEYAGQEHLLARGKPLRAAIEKGRIGSIVFWGPPGTGKTTLARLLARTTEQTFEPFSAVSEGVPRLREIFAAAQGRLARGDGRTVLFVDEIHRLNKGQQDALLPAVEEGLVTLIGATTENPSFELNGALLSRVRVFVLRPLSEDHLLVLLRRALEDRERGLGAEELVVDDEAMALVAREADGDARRALTVLEAAAADVGRGGQVTLEAAREALQKRFARYDKGGEENYNMLSAFHKSLRGSDPQGALYWMARMLEGGEDPMTIFRRAIAMAAEDVGLADPRALQLAVAARDAYHMLGAPEGYLPLAEMVVYLATAPKSNSAKAALHAALALAQETPAAPVPLHIRNAPTKLMKDLGYHEGYQFAHDSPDHYLPQEYLPEEIAERVLYEPGPFGYEREIAKRLEWWAQLKARAAGRDAPGADEAPSAEA